MSIKHLPHLGRIISDRTVAHLLSHTSTQMVARYARLAPSHLRAAVEGLVANQWPTAAPSPKAKKRITP